MQNLSSHDTQVLIVGGSLVGLSAALFLAWRGADTILVERHRGSSPHPRAIGFTELTMEHYRAAGIEDRIPQMPADLRLRRIKVESLAGQWQEETPWTPGHVEPNKGVVSPCTGAAIAQDLLEPILRTAAAERSADLRHGVDLQDGTLDSVWEHKAEPGSASVEEIRAEYETGYRTDVERITINGDVVTFYKGGKPLEGRYAYDGKEVLTYKTGNRGVRFIFKKTDGDADAPLFIQFSDHKIAPEKADHYHLYWGNDRAALLEEVTNWPTYYPSSLNAKQIASEMMAH